MSKRKTIKQRFWQTINAFVEPAVTRNIVLTQAMGLCPIIAAGTTLQNGVALTALTAIVLLPLGFIMPLVGSHLPKWIRPVLYVLCATLLLIGASYLLETYISPGIYARLYLFIPLVAVNMLHAHSAGLTRIMSTAETIIDALGTTIGFGAVVCVISAVREIAAYGTLWNKPIDTGMILPQAAAPYMAFILLAFMSANLQWLRQRITAYFAKKEAEHA